mmetsp:Transcript_62383/g.163752  ORF Transcript_62383/g.163752 Transcript_62383/m.163752 type:complete len:320 (+) Transcript_62383:247-1206(+)
MKKTSARRTWTRGVHLMGRTAARDHLELLTELPFPEVPFCSPPGSQGFDRMTGGSGLVERGVRHRVVDVLLVLLNGARPVEVARHPVLHETLVLLGVLVEGLHGEPHALLPLVRGEGGHVVAVGGLLGRLVRGAGVLDAVLEPASGVDHRHGTVGEGHHLRDAAGLVAGGHEQEVAACHHVTLHLRAEARVSAHPALVLGLHGLEPLRQVFVAVAHEDDLHATCNAVPLVLQHPVDDALLQDVDALLRGKPADKADQARCRVLVQAQALLEERLADRLPGQVLRPEVRGDVLVRRRVPGVLDAVLDARQINALSLAVVL